MAARRLSSFGPGSKTTETGPAATIQVFVPGPVYGPGLGAMTRVTRGIAARFGSTRAVRWEVDVGAIGSRGVEPAVEVHGDEEPNQGLTHLWHGQRPPRTGRSHAHFPPRSHRLRGN